MAWLVLRSRAKFYQHGGYYVSKAEVGVAAMGLSIGSYRGRNGGGAKSGSKNRGPGEWG